jgi:hypothetical protein
MQFVIRIVRGRDSDSLRAERSGDRIPVGASLSPPLQTGPGAHPASYTMGIGSFPGVKRPGRGVDHPPPSSAEVEGRVELYICSPSGPSWPVLGRSLPLPLLRISGVINSLLFNVNTLAADLILIFFRNGQYAVAVTSSICIY